MPKDIVILLDGTSNEIGARRSNILRLYGTLQKLEDQVVYYDPGVGTFGAENAWSRTWRKTVEVWGMATGWGLDANVKEAYRFLVENYEIDVNGTPDRIHIFGFSRGAYCARILAGFLHAFGMMEKRNLNLLDYAYRAYKRIGEDDRKEAFEELRLHERMMQPHRPVIRFLGLFDTVSSVIESGKGLPRIRNKAHTARNPSVQIVRHAVAIDERRTMFRPQLWPEGQTFEPNRFNKAGEKPQDAREVWFSGVHGDVGGGYPEAKSALAKLPLAWLIDQAREAGLRFNQKLIDRLVLGADDKYVKPDPTAKVQDSMSFGWKLLEFVPRSKPSGSRRASLAGFSLPLMEPRHIPEGARIHRSVVDRIEGLKKPLPNLPASYSVEGEPEGV
ncbi:DUF2235 domain-containing protein [Sulfitobacter sp. TSTF-M16]|uniref:DUF2235 domain-containing protein n=1 Tax=Sulfitobacter aestuariivivens TaxID=2766981 RepID=A0A927D414_9RHOB|nr:DUF2235 domain-containing protein [Sulfitobacter aestuariivivens]MBD3664755.1 DUF2235 domain-containing protein [Sulfitobacter aestuariivivens]